MLGVAHLAGIYLLGAAAGAVAASAHLGPSALLYALMLFAGALGALGSVVIFARIFHSRIKS